MRPTLFALTLLAATATLAQAQTRFPVPAAATTPPSRPLIVFPGTNGATCPLAMAAQQQSSGQTIWTVALEDERSPMTAIRPGDAGVHVRLVDFKDKAIRQVKLAVYFIAPGSRATPVTESETGVTSDLQKTFELIAAEGSAHKLAGDLLVGPAASITRVHVLSITYADGSTWQASSTSNCTIEPNRIILVGSR
jgi:hypothetical protein